MGKNLLTKFIVALFLFVLLSTHYILHATFTLAAVTPIPPQSPCSASQREDPNFNSTRPYQASPCGDSTKAVMCGNTLQIFEDTPGITAKAGTTSWPLNFNMPEKTYAVDLSGASFPIAGNTEQTANSKTATDQIDDAAKMNEYLNWYLSGVTGKAEYGSDDPNKIINFSGPVKKLLPSMIQDAQRINVIKSITQNVAYSPDNTPQNTGQHPGPGATTTEPSNHNQIVVCATKQYVLGPIGWVLGMVNTAIPHNCYSGDNSKSQPTAYRLDDWLTADLGGRRAITNWLIDLVKNIPIINNNIIVESLNTAWNKKTPPLPWDNGNGKPFKDDVSYQKAYNEWRGDTCILVPVINKLFCFANPAWASPEWSELYQYVPLSVNVDKQAKNIITSVQIQGENGTDIVIPKIASNIIKEPILYFPHTQETLDLSNLLNKTYIPQTGTSHETLVSSTEPQNDPATGQCRTLDLRSNPGDNLFAELESPAVKVQTYPFTVTRIPCHDVTTSRDYLYPSEIAAGIKYTGPITTTYAACKGQVSIKIVMKTKVPFADQIFNSTTAGADSTFRKIYPKVEAGAPVNCIADIPSVTSVTYTPTQGISKDNFKVLGPGNVDTTSDPKLYFPHFGSVYDYFLKGIQTALRPQGYADPSPISGMVCTSSQAGGDCSFDKNLINQAITKAANKYNVPAEILKGMFQIESADWINNPSSYQCTENSAHAAGVMQTTKSAYDAVTCPDERLQNDIGVCSQTAGKLSRCSVQDDAELAARELLWKAGKLNGCKPIGGISISSKMEWYNSVCDYYGSFAPDDLTRNYAKDIPANERRQNGDMNYCDIVCWSAGQCSGSNYPAR